MDKITVTCDTKELKGRFFLTPVDNIANNGSSEITGKSNPYSCEYLLGGAPIKFELRAETEDGTEIVSTQCIPLQPSIEILEKNTYKNEIKFKVYNTRHFYLNRGIGRIDCKGEVTPDGEGGFYFIHTFNVPTKHERADKYNSLRAICLPVISNSETDALRTASLPFCLEISLGEFNI